MSNTNNSETAVFIELPVVIYIQLDPPALMALKGNAT